MIFWWSFDDLLMIFCCTCDALWRVYTFSIKAHRKFIKSVYTFSSKIHTFSIKNIVHQKCIKSSSQFLSNFWKNHSKFNFFHSLLTNLSTGRAQGICIIATSSCMWLEPGPSEYLILSERISIITWACMKHASNFRPSAIFLRASHCSLPS